MDGAITSGRGVKLWDIGFSWGFLNIFGRRRMDRLA
jgi:hypothetical protein